MADSKEIAQIESINKALTTLNGTLDKTAESYLRIVKTVETGNKTINDTTQNFENLEKAQKETKKTGDQLDSISKQLLASEQKLKEIEDTRYQQIVKNRVAIQQKTQAIKDTVKAEGLAETSLVKMRQRLKELTIEYDRSGTRTKAAASEINKLSREIGKAEAATNRHQRGVGGYADQLGMLPGRFGAAANGAMGMGKQLWALVANPVGAVIAAIVLALTGLYKAFTSTDTGATAFASVLKAIGNVLDVLLDRLWSYYKMLGSLVTFDWEGVKKNAKDAFGGIGKAISDAAKAGWDYAQVMDDIKDRESASLARQAKLRVEIETLKNQAKDRTKADKERLDFAQTAFNKERELLEIEKQYLEEKTSAEADNLASKINNENLSLENKRKLLDEWLLIDDKQLNSALKNNEAFAKFYNENEDAIQELQKMKSDDVLKDAEFQRETRRLQSELNRFRFELIDEQEKKREEENKKQIEAGKETVKALVDQLKEQSEAIKDSLDGNKDEFDKYLDDVMKSVEDEAAKEMDAYLDKEDEKLKKKKETADKEKEIEKELAKAKWEIGKELGNALFELTGNRIEKELQALEVEKNAKLDNDKLTTEQRAQIEAEYTKKSTELKAKQAKQDKLQALFNIAISTAQAIMSFLAKGSVPLSIAAGIMGAIQAGVVLAEPIPKFAKGTKNAPDKGVFAEAGSELMELTSGKLIYSDKPTYFEGNQFKGATIYTNKETKEIINQTEHSGFSGRTMTDDRIIKGLAGVERAINRKPVAIHDDEYKTIGYQSGSHKTIYLNRITHR